MTTSTQALLENSWIARVLQQWKDEHIDLSELATPNDILNAERMIGFAFPNQFKELYFIVDGFKDYDWRVNMFSIWPIKRIVDEYLFSKDKNFVGFADYLIKSHQIGFSKTSQGVFKYYDRPELISETFEKAILLINEDSDLIYV